MTARGAHGSSPMNRIEHMYHPRTPVAYRHGGTTTSHDIGKRTFVRHTPNAIRTTNKRSHGRTTTRTSVRRYESPPTWQTTTNKRSDGRNDAYGTPSPPDRLPPQWLPSQLSGRSARLPYGPFARRVFPSPTCARALAPRVRMCAVSRHATGVAPMDGARGMVGAVTGVLGANDAIERLFGVPNHGGSILDVMPSYVPHRARYAIPPNLRTPVRQ